jgi:predicted ester cyclase
VNAITDPRRVEHVARCFAAAVDAQDWQGLADLLSPTFSARYVHTGETFTRESFVAANRDYPGAQRFLLEDVVVSEGRAVLRARVTDASGTGDTYYVASFATVRDDKIEQLVEVWTDVVTTQPPPHRAAAPTGDPAGRCEHGGMGSERAETIAAYENYLARCNEHRFDELGEFVDENVSGSGPDDGLAAYVEGLHALVAAFPDWRWELQDRVVQGCSVAARLIGRGTHAGPFQGVAPTGRPVEVQELVGYRFADGRITHCWGDLYPVIREVLTRTDRPAG